MVSQKAQQPHACRMKSFARLPVVHVSFPLDLLSRSVSVDQLSVRPGEEPHSPSRHQAANNPHYSYSQYSY